MKKLIAVALLTASLTLSSFAQSTNTTPANLPTTPADFLANVKEYVASVNTNLSWNATKFDLWTAVNYQSGLQVSDELGGSYDLFNVATNIVIAPEVVFRNAGIAGTIVSGAGGVGVSYEYYDLKITGYIDGGYSPSLNSGFAEIGARLKKKMTTSTYIGVGLGYEWLFKGKAPTTPSATAFIGWTF